MTILRDDERAAADAALAREAALRRHVVVALSGAHAYGFPSPDSDLDLKAVHMAPTASLLGLDPQTGAADFVETIGGIEVDYTSNELGGVIAGVLGGNGNFLERILGEHILVSSAEHRELIPLCRRALSQRYVRHYRGFARQQLAAVEREEAPTAKTVLYVLRTSLTGTHLLTSGELVVDVRPLLDEYGYGEAHELIAQKRAGERVTLGLYDKALWLATLARVMARLDAAARASSLPAEPSNRAELEAWLIDARRALL